MRIFFFFIAALAAAPAAFAAQAVPDSASAQSRRDSARTLEAVTVRAIRSAGGATAHAPFASTVIGEAEIEARSFGQDMPLLLQGTPSLTSHSETGSYWGYSYLRLRGIDQSRINLTIDGIPLNDPEDQVLYFADFPDLANSIGSVQVQRGVGTSAPGTASYGGSINFETTPLLTSERSAELQLQRGSFDTWRASGEFASGLTSSGLSAYARLSAIQSDGFRNHSGMLGRSGFLSVGYVDDRQMVKLTAIAGLFADTLAYLGASEAELTQDREFNPLRRDELDRFGEQVAALSYTRHLGGGGAASATAYRISAAGNYDVCIGGCDQPVADLWNFHLDFAWYGATATWTLERDRWHGSVGVNGNTYARDHYAFARPDFSSPLYFNTGHKQDASVFGKVAYDIGRLTLFGDLQGRRAGFRFTPDANAGVAPAPVSWGFLNPKAGVTLRVSPDMDVYASYGRNSREPARSDMMAGFDNLDTTNAVFVGPFDRVRPERVHDLESGLRYRSRAWAAEVNLFAMEFRDEILPVGRLSYIGTPLRTNVSRSRRHGIEVDFDARPVSTTTVGVTATLMRGRIARFVDDESGREYRDVEPLLTPRFTTTQTLSVDATGNLRLTVTGRASSSAQLDNTGDPALVLPAYYTADISAELAIAKHALAIFVNNVANSQRYSGGHVSFGEARYFVLPPRNVFLVARVGM